MSTTHEDIDRMYDEFKREDFHRLNGHFPWTLARRVAFSRWRRAVLWLADLKWLPELWHDRLLDALYPDDCVVTFK